MGPFHRTYVLDGRSVYYHGTFVKSNHCGTYPKSNHCGTFVEPVTRTVCIAISKSHQRCAHHYGAVSKSNYSPTLVTSFNKSNHKPNHSTTNSESFTISNPKSFGTWFANPKSRAFPNPNNKSHYPRTNSKSFYQRTYITSFFDTNSKSIDANT
ncbi:MAG: hypothetical protein ACTSUE_05215 [Promethearchaeota archaeon]